jgi:hypothetical protein
MATVLRVVEDPPDVQAAEWLQSADDKILACRGWGHSWPKVRAGRMRKGISAVRQHGGCYQVTFTCADCGMERTLTTLPGGQLDLPAKYTYRQPKGYASPKGSGISRRDCAGESWRRAVETVAATGSEGG